MNISLKSGLSKPLTNRTVTADYLFEHLDDFQFERVLSNLRQGGLKATAFIHWLGNDTSSWFDNKKHELRSESWKYFDLRLPGKHRGVEHVYLLDYNSDQVHKDITLTSTNVNRILGLTRQGGGQRPKMPPRLYAFLAVWYSRESFVTDPEMLLSILEGKHDLWGSAGVIDGRRGLDAVKEYLSALEEFEGAFDMGDTGIDVSIASGV